MALRAKFPMSYVLKVFQKKWKLDEDFKDEIKVTIREKANASSFSNNPFRYFLFKGETKLQIKKVRYNCNSI